MNANVLVDTENISTKDCSYLNRVNGGDTVFLFTSKAKSKFDIEVIQAIIDSEATIRIIPVRTVGKNAVDFVITAWAAKLAASEPETPVQIISADMDYIHVCRFGSAIADGNMAEITQFKSFKEFLLLTTENSSKPHLIDDYSFLAV